MQQQPTPISSKIVYGTSKPIDHSKLRNADALLRRWVWLSRGGLPNLGYKKIDLASDGPGFGGDITVLSEDEWLMALMADMPVEMRNISRQFWGKGMTISEIALAEGLSRKQVSRRIVAIREQVVKHCFY